MVTEQHWKWIKAELERRGYLDLRHQGRSGNLEGVSLRTWFNGPVRRLGALGRTKEQAVRSIMLQAPLPLPRCSYRRPEACPARPVVALTSPAHSPSDAILRLFPAPRLSAAARRQESSSLLTVGQEDHGPGHFPDLRALHTQ